MQLAWTAPLAIALLLQAGAPERAYRIDYSLCSRDSDMEVLETRLEPNHADGRSRVFRRPGLSALAAWLELPARPTSAILELEHLSSGGNVRLGGNSRISILVNGEALVKEWEVGAHGYAVDRLTLTKLLKKGENALEVKLVAGETAYWLKRLELQCAFPPGTKLEGEVRRLSGKGSYAVVVSKRTLADGAWAEVVEALKEKHAATVLVYPGSVQDVRAALAEIQPRFACFVARPEELGRGFVVHVHRLTRALDDDPYGDVLWGIVTGARAADALRIARQKEPLTIRRAAAGCSLDLEAFEEGVWYSECEKNAVWERPRGQPPEKRRCPDDTTKLLADLLNDYRPGFFLTSGHATQHDWQIGFSYKNGQFRAEGGRLFGIDVGGQRHDIDSPAPKVYLAAGNCLLGLVEDQQAMVLGWLGSGGACQVAGYVVSTWYGHGGWGVLDFFVQQAGRFTFAESFHLNQQALLHELESRFPRAARRFFERWDIETDGGLLEALAKEHGLHDRDELGLLWDRDTVAFYGDPAWEARVAPVKELPWSQKLTERGGELTFEVETKADGEWRRPIVALLPRRVRGATVVRGGELRPEIADDFLLIPRQGKFSRGEKRTVVFRTQDAR